ncbi:MAG: hypothetical protein ACTHN3_11150 [Solirubrobacterales bacterium]
MSASTKEQCLVPDSLKENRKMFKRLVTIAATLGAALTLLVTLPISSASAAKPWWQVLTGSRPTNMWEPGLEKQEVTGQKFFGLIFAVKVEVAGNVVGCLGSGTLAGFGGPSANQVCEEQAGFPASETAPEFEEMLEGPYGPGEVEVTGGPAGTQPFEVKSPWGSPIKITPLEAFGFPLAENAASKVSKSSEFSGRLVVTLTNLGDAPVDGGSAPVTIVDRLPEGAIAEGVEAVAGGLDKHGGLAQPVPHPVECAVEAADEVVCTYEGQLPSYEAIEVEILTILTGSPPTVGAPGEVTVSGGNAAAASAVQRINVSNEPVPFGIEQFSASAEEEGGKVFSQAGGHPFQFTTTLQLNAGAVFPTSPNGKSIGARPIATEQPALPRNLRFSLPAGLVGNAAAMHQCDMAIFVHVEEFINACPEETVVGVTSVTIVEDGLLGLFREAVPVFNLPPAHGEPARFGFLAGGAAVLINTAVDPNHAYRITASVSNASQAVQFLSATTTLWGTPGDALHDNSRGWNCVYLTPPGPCERPPNLGENAFMRMPVQCSSPLDFGLELEPWNVPIGSLVDSKPYTSEALRGCNRVPFDPSTQSSPSSKLAENPSGLEFELDMPNANLLNKDGIAEGQAKKVEVTLPEGMSINPSEGEGLVGCTPDEYERETAESKAGEGCPEASKVGTVQISTPLLPEEEARGSLYVASPHDNPFDSLIALYIVAKIPDRGILIKQPVRVDANPVTGQLTAISDNLPQLPFSSFKLQFRPGGRAPLVTPPACGTYNVVSRFTPWSAQDPNNPAPDEIVTRESPFTVERGVDGGACPSGGTPPFHPNLLAGSINNAAGHYSPFSVRLTRNDGEQEFTNFSIKLPPGVVGKLAGIPFCSNAAIAAAKARTGPNGGAEELASPSCPAASEIGHTLVGAGVGNSLTYVPGKLYLAGPYNGSPLSIVSITAAKVGPFDLGTVVVREALRINPETAEVFVDATGSDPIPHIIQGIPVHARDIRIYVDRPNFVLNPTSCERTSTASTVVGSGRDFGSAADNEPVTVTSPFQAADCASLGFKPRLSLKLRGKTNRGGNPALRAVLRPRPGDANASKISVALPHSEFLDQGHIRTVCTRVQFKAGAGNGAECPAGAVYGHARAWSPLFSEPLEGPVFLRSSEHPLPDLVLALHGLVDIQAVGRIDSVHGGIRNTFDFVPDAPITKVVLEMQGGKKGLLENSTNICRGKHQAAVEMEGHNGRLHNFHAPLKPKCGKAKHRPRH